MVCECDSLVIYQQSSMRVEGKQLRRDKFDVKAFQFHTFQLADWNHWLQTRCERFDSMISRTPKRILTLVTRLFQLFSSSSFLCCINHLSKLYLLSTWPWECSAGTRTNRFTRSLWHQTSQATMIHPIKRFYWDVHWRTLYAPSSSPSPSSSFTGWHLGVLPTHFSLLQ